MEPIGTMQLASQAGFFTEFLGHLWVHCLQPFSTGVRPPLGALVQFYFELCLGQLSLHPYQNWRKNLTWWRSWDLIQAGKIKPRML